MKPAARPARGLAARTTSTAIIHTDHALSRFIHDWKRPGPQSSLENVSRPSGRFVTTSSANPLPSVVSHQTAETGTTIALDVPHRSNGRTTHAKETLWKWNHFKTCSSRN